MKKLIGKRIDAIEVSMGEKFLVFRHPDGSHTCFHCYGDCCSETWFADITGVSALLGSTVIGVEEVDVAVVEDGRCRQEFDAFYGVKLKTDKGHADIVYRNSSNGYYGGDCDLYIGPLPDNLRRIHDDWRA